MSELTNLQQVLLVSLLFCLCEAALLYTLVRLRWDGIFTFVLSRTVLAAMKLPLHITPFNARLQLWTIERRALAYLIDWNAWTILGCVGYLWMYLRVDHHA